MSTVPPFFLMFLLITGGVLIIAGSCYDAKWYWLWAGGWLSKLIGHEARRLCDFVGGIILLTGGILLTLAAFAPIGVYSSTLIAIIFACIFASIIYRISGANFINAVFLRLVKGTARKQKSHFDD